MLAQKPTIQPFNDVLQFHLLRHFMLPGDFYIKELSEKISVPISDIYRELSLPASKFNQAFAKNPLELLDRITETTKGQWNIVQTSDAKTDYRIIFDKTYWQQGIGKEAMLAVNEINDEQREKVKLKQRDNLWIQTLQVDELPLTSQMIIVVASVGQTITAFPGRWLPPLNEEVAKKWIFLVK